MKKICAISGKEFEISDAEIALRKKGNLECLPKIAPKYRIRHIGAFWPHWNLYKRKCERTERGIISVFSEKCPYPVWNKDEWMREATPPGLNFDETKDVFPQMWEFFQKSPIPHSIGTGSDNCEYTDDGWYSKDCYLTHSFFECENLKYSYRQVKVKDSQFAVFSFSSELCADIVNCRECFELIYAVNCRNCSNSVFLYDCRNCQNCLFCFNLRNKSYCIGNKQLTKDQYEIEKKKWNFSSRKIYDQGKRYFVEMMEKLAWHRSLFIDKCENSQGTYLEHTKNCTNSFFLADSEDCVNFVRGYQAKDCVDCLGTGINNSQLIFYSCQANDRNYDVKFSHNITRCRFVEYCGFCFQCEHCFGCLGLVGKKFYIFNKPYSEVDYKGLKDKIVKKMKQTGEYGEFFPGYFSPVPYEESWSNIHFPLSREEQEKFNFRLQEMFAKKNENYSSPGEISDSLKEVNQSITKKVFWDTKAKKPFQIQVDDIEFCQKLGVPLPNEFYISRIAENFSWLPFNGELRKTMCGKCNVEIETAWSEKLDIRILCEKCYLGVVK